MLVMQQCAFWEPPREPELGKLIFDERGHLEFSGARTVSWELDIPVEVQQFYSVTVVNDVFNTPGLRCAALYHTINHDPIALFFMSCENSDAFREAVDVFEAKRRELYVMRYHAEVQSETDRLFSQEDITTELHDLVEVYAPIFLRRDSIVAFEHKLVKEVGWASELWTAPHSRGALAEEEHSPKLSSRQSDMAERFWAEAFMPYYEQAVEKGRWSSETTREERISALWFLMRVVAITHFSELLMPTVESRLHGPLKSATLAELIAAYADFGRSEENLARLAYLALASGALDRLDEPGIGVDAGNLLEALEIIERSLPAQICG